MNDLFDSPQRKGNSGRIPDSKRERHKIYPKVNVSIDPDTFERLEKFCEDEERAKSWVIQKALDVYLASKGY